MQVRIRLARRKDIKELSKVYAAVYRKFDAGEDWTEKKACVLLSYWLNRQPDMFFVADIDGNLAGGFVAGIKPWWDGNRLFDGEIFVHPELQGKGIGSLLSKALFKKAVEKYSAKVWDTHTFRRRFPLKWYKELGFREIKEWLLITGDIRKALRKLENKR